MKKKKSTEVLLSPVQYWEMKLNINFETEFIRYKNLCAKLSKKEMRKLDGTYYITYSGWEQKIIAMINTLDKNELYELIHFLAGSASQSNITNKVYTYLFPFLVSFLLPYTYNFLNALYGSNYLMLVLICCFIGGLKCFWMIVVDTKDVLFRSEFYKDIAHIAEKML